MASAQTQTSRILIALVAGALAGLLINGASDPGDWLDRWLTQGLLLILGKWFLALLMLIVVPLVFVSLVKGVGRLNDTRSLGRISAWTLSLYIGTTALAISIGMGLALLFAPGEGMGLIASGQAPSTPPPSITQMLIDLIPTNPIAAMAQGNMLQVILFALLFGTALALSVPGRISSSIIFQFMDELDALLMRMVNMIMLLAPIGVFALMARSVASQGADVFLPLIGYFFTVLLALAIHGLISYPLMLRALTSLPPLMLLQKLRDVVTFAFSTSSSAATIPVTLDTTNRKLGVSEQVSGFTIPLGATINMDGTAIMQGVATVFIANAYGVPLHGMDFVLIILTATLASIGTAAVPSAGLIMLTLVLTQAGLPVEGIALILGVDRLLDMVRTAVNVSGDVTVTSIVAYRTGQLDTVVFRTPTPCPTQQETTTNQQNRVG